jgi:signal transduction histidine kinase
MGGDVIPNQVFTVWWVCGMVRREHQSAMGVIVLEERNRELDAFAGRVAHDLRGPLAAINLSAAVLSQHVPQTTGAYAGLQRGVARMEALIADLLTLSRISAQLPKAATLTSTIGPALEEDLGPKVKEAGGDLRIQLEPAKVRCIEGFLRQALGNVGENSVKYRRPDAHLEIDVQGRLVGHCYEFRISDNGCGMSPSVVRHIFEPLFRGEKVGSIPGTGLGLAIVKRVIEASGGTVSVASAIGTGSTFTINLPLDNEDNSGNSH